jgi:D-lactate dehydrogenase
VSAAAERLRRRAGAELVPAWTESTPRAAPRRLPATTREGAAAVYLPSCLNRIFGNARDALAGPTVPEAIVSISARAGMPVWIPDDVAGHCCGVPWSSKGYSAGHQLMAARTAAAVRRWSDDGRIPVVIDASSCTQGVVSELGVDGPAVLDSIVWVHDHLLDRLRITRRVPRIAVHPNCSCTQLGLGPKLAAIAQRISDEVVIPAATGCCGMAGDRGWLHPELPSSALREVVRELRGEQFDDCVSSNRTCELAMRQVTGRQYRSFVLAIEELTR